MSRAPFASLVLAVLAAGIAGCGGPSLPPGTAESGDNGAAPSEDRSSPGGIRTHEGRSIGFARASREEPGGVFEAGEDILDVAFSSDGARVALALADGTIRILDVATVSETMRLDHPHVTERPYVRAVAFSPDGRSLASANDEGTLVLWNVERPSR